MDAETVQMGLVLLALLFFFLGSGLWVAMSLMGTALIGIALFSNVPQPGYTLSSAIWETSTPLSLTALPLFVWMGEILFRTRLSEDMFRGLAPWMAPLPGRLMHVNVVGCGIFAAISGSSAATCATIGKMAIPELKGRGYDEKMTIGTLAGSGTLGLLIPPSIILIVYGVATEQSIARLFVAGVLPGAMLMAMFMAYIAIWSRLHPDRTPPYTERVPFAERIRVTLRLLPAVLLILMVLGSVYLGLATPTEAAAVGVAGALVLAWATGSLDRKSFLDSLTGATRTSCMIAFILLGAAFLTRTMGFTGIPRELAEWIGEMGLSTYALIAALTLLFAVLGCFLDGISVVVLTTSVIMPLVTAAGIDPIWFGIYLVVVVEMSQITPPVGFNLFVLQGLTGRDILYVAGAALPFFLLMVLAVIILMFFPEVATWLPEQMSR